MTVPSKLRMAKQSLEQRGDDITAAARVLIGSVRRTERAAGARTMKAELSLDVELTAGGTETGMTITIERTASSH
jgi:hypothetical protein